MTWSIVKPYADAQMQRVLAWTCDMLNASVETAAEIGCTPAAVVAQAALETGWGKAAIGNNVFGIKADPGWNGAKQLRRTWEQRPDGSTYFVNDWFRDYPTLADGVWDHFRFLKENARYANVFDHDDTVSDLEYFHQLQADGYATDLNYASKLGAMLDSVHTFMARMSEDPAAAVKVERPLIMSGMKGGPVVQLQQALKMAGFDPGAIDGDFGHKTLAAVKLFQASKGLTIDGLAGDQTQDALGMLP